MDYNATIDLYFLKSKYVHDIFSVIKANYKVDL